MDTLGGGGGFPHYHFHNMKNPARIAITKVSKNWKWESQVSEIKKLFVTTLAIQFTHVRHSGNKVEDLLANAGVGK